MGLNKIDPGLKNNGAMSERVQTQVWKTWTWVRPRSEKMDIGTEVEPNGILEPQKKWSQVWKNGTRSETVWGQLEPGLKRLLGNRSRSENGARSMKMEPWV